MGSRKDLFRRTYQELTDGEGSSYWVEVDQVIGVHKTHYAHVSGTLNIEEQDGELEGVFLGSEDIIHSVLSAPYSKILVVARDDNEENLKEKIDEKVKLEPEGLGYKTLENAHSFKGTLLLTKEESVPLFNNTIPRKLWLNGEEVAPMELANKGRGELAKNFARELREEAKILKKLKDKYL